MNAILLLAATMTAAVPTEAEIKAFATGFAKTFVDQILKAPKGAEYGVYRLVPLGQTSIYPGNRYRVMGYVDANNVLGTKLRAEWDAVIHIDPADKLVTLGLTYTGLDGDPELLYEAPAERWCRPDVYKAIHEEYQALIDEVAAARRALPKRARKASTSRKVEAYLISTRKKYGLAPGQLSKILGLPGMR